jgi:hypothetical protein
MPVARRDSETDSLVNPESPIETGPCGPVAAEARLLGEGALGGACCSASPIAGELTLASREGAACAFADGSGRRDSRPLARATAAVMARWPVLGEVATCFDGPVERRICREACELRGGGNRVATGRCSSLAALGVEAGAMRASPFDASVAAVEAAEGDMPVAAAVDSLLASAALGVTAAEALIAGVGDSAPAMIDGLGAVAVNSGTGAVTRGCLGAPPAHIVCFTWSTACRASSVARSTTFTAAKRASRLSRT